MNEVCGSCAGSARSSSNVAIRHGWKPRPFTSSLRSGDPSTSLRAGSFDLESVAHPAVLAGTVSVINQRVRRVLEEERKQHPTHFGAGVRGLPPLCAQNAHKDGAPFFLLVPAKCRFLPLVGMTVGWSLKRPWWWRRSARSFDCARLRLAPLRVTVFGNGYLSSLAGP